MTSISQTILKNSHLHILTNLEKKKKKSILERHQRAERREKKIKMRGLSKGDIWQTMSRARDAERCKRKFSSGNLAPLLAADLYEILAAREVNGAGKAL